MWIECLILLTLALFLFYRWATVNNDFFKKRGIPYDKPVFLLGSFVDLIRRKKSVFDVILDLYNAHDGQVYGIFNNRNPSYLIKDPELIRNMTIRDFDHFVNHLNTFLKDDTKESDLFGSSLILLKNAKWKDMRATLSPAFTGSKMRNTFILLNQVAQQACDYLKEQNDALDKDGIELDVKEFAKRFTNDIIATTAFGIQVDSFKDKTNDFYMMGNGFTKFSFWTNVKIFLFTNFGSLFKLLKLSLFDKKCTQYFMDLILNAMKYRKDHNITRPDMINMLMEARANNKSSSREWNDIEMVAQCLLFFLAGFETVASTISFTVYELMENPEVQEKLFAEIRNISNDLDNEPLSYDILQKMPYLEMVINEVLRKWPGTLAVDRICNKDITYDLDNGLKLDIKQGDAVLFVLNGLHMDGKYWNNPKEFNPERFSEENKANIKPFTYAPFGFGQRSCIASRLALLEIKSLIFYLVRDFQIEASAKTCKPFKLSTSALSLEPEGGFWLKLKARK